MKTKSVSNKNIYKILILVLVLILELIVFNWRFFEGMGYKSQNLVSYTCGSGVEYIAANEIKVKNDGDKWIEFDGFDTKVNNIYIDIVNKRTKDKNEMKDGSAHDFQKVAVALSITDEANALFMDMPERVAVQGVERTKYIRLHTAGSSDKLRIKFNGAENQTFLINRVTLNKQVPFSINILRMLFLYAVFMLAYMLRYGSPVYKTKCMEDSYGQAWVIILLAFVNIVTAGVISMNTPMFKSVEMGHHKQYNELADSFIAGHVYLDGDQPPQALIDMENPYDKKLRDQVMAENHTGCRWDTAYYKGKYYVYFGALPVVVYYMPYKLATGEDFQTYAGVFVNSMLFIIFAFLLIGAIVKKWFKDIPFASYLLLIQTFISSSYIVMGLRKPDLYSMPITMAIMLVTGGLYFWISAYGSKNKIIQGIKLAVGSLFMAAVAGCRPQFLIASFLAIPLFWDTVFKKRELFSKKSIGHSLAFVLPYIAAATVVMCYNKARFGSVFDFGANYNLTTNDMTRRGFVLGRVPLGLFCYMLQPPVICARFPFLTGANLSNNYMGVTITELMLGGIYATQPILWIVALVKFVKNELKEKGLFAFVICSLVFSAVVAVADAQMSGILCRYYMDFAYLSLIPAVIIALVFIKKYNNGKVYFAITVLAALCLCSDFMIMLVPGDYSHEYTNPNLYYAISSAFTFWM